MPEAVVITGIGLRTPMGNSLAEVREVFAAGRSVVQGFEGPQGQKRVGARLTEDFSESFSRMDRMLMDPVAQLAALAADSALADSGMALDQVDRNRIGVVMGTGQSTLHTQTEQSEQLLTKNQVKSTSILRGLGNGVSNHISLRHHLGGESQTIILACAASNSAIGAAFRLVRDGTLDAVVTGGSETTFCEGGMRAWEAMRVLAPPDPERPETTCRPFSKDRGGIVLGEGAVVYVLESERQAKARGARIYARILGYGASCDGTHITQPDPGGQARAIAAALRDAGVGASDVTYLNAHGTGTGNGDPSEVQSIHLGFGDHAKRLAISSTKSMHGHALGATGALELLAPILALKEGLIAPTANLYNPDPEFDLDFVPIHARQGVDVQVAMSSSFAFGGSNACLVLGR